MLYPLSVTSPQVLPLTSRTLTDPSERPPSASHLSASLRRILAISGPRSAPSKAAFPASIHSENITQSPYVKVSHPARAQPRRLRWPNPEDARAADDGRRSQAKAA